MNSNPATVESELIVENLSRLENKQSIMFTASNRRDGTTTTLIATAKILAKHMDASILIVDGNMKSPGIHHYWKQAPSPGLSDVLGDTTISLDDIIRKENSWAHLITSGENELIGSKALTSKRFQELFGQLKKTYDFILFDMGPVNLFPALHHIMSLMDGVVLVVACESTRWEVAQNVKQKLEAAGADILGVILTKRKYYIPKWLYKYV
jgi:capsular exopolysaccharide synthesis family protein